MRHLQWRDEGIDGYVLVIARVDGRGDTLLSRRQLAGCHLARDRPKHTLQSPSSPSFPFNPPRRSPPAFAWLVHEAEAIDNPALVGPAPYTEPSDVDLCVADRAGCRADGSIQLGITPVRGLDRSQPPGLHLRGPVDDDGKRHVAAGPTPWSFAQARSTSPSSSRSGSSARISSIVSSGSALPSHTSAERTVSDQASNDASRGNTPGRPATM